MDQTYFQKGFGLRSEIRPQLHENYRSQVVDVMRANGFRLEAGGLTFMLAIEFGFCYGVERAVEYAYETITKFPNQRIFLTGEIIHNPHVNNKLKRMGIGFLPDGPGKYDTVSQDDVVLIPAFGIPAAEIDILAGKSCVIVDTTCGSVLNVWKNVERYARAGVTSIIHGKSEHEETEATFSRTTLFPGAHYLVVRDRNETAFVCDYIEKRGDRAEFLGRFQKAISRGFDPEVHLERIGLANQTTMLSSESLQIAEMLRAVRTRRHGPEEMATRGWLSETAQTIGITAGASTPNNQIGESIERILSFRGTMDLATIIGAH